MSLDKNIDKEISGQNGNCNTDKLDLLMQFGEYYLSEYLLRDWYVYNLIYPCIFIKKPTIGFAIIIVYADDLNLVGTLKELTIIVDYLKVEFEMKYLKKQNFVLAYRSNTF